MQNDNQCRIQGLYQLLSLMGYSVYPVKDNENIKYLAVTTDHNPSEELIAEMSASPHISAPLNSSKIRDMLSSSTRTGDNVINFPDVH